MPKEFRYPVIIICFFTLIGAMIILSLQKIGPSMNPPREIILMDSLQTSFISIKEENGNWLFSNSICSPGMMLNKCNLFKWEDFSKYKLPIGKDRLSVFIAKDLSKRDAVKLFSMLKQMPIKALFLSSPIDSSLSNSKKADPSPLFSSSLTQLIKWNLFSKLGLSTVYKFTADFIVVDKKVESLFNEKIYSEIKRRKIPLLFTYQPKRGLLDHEYVLVD